MRTGTAFTLWIAFWIVPQAATAWEPIHPSQPTWSGAEVMYEMNRGGSDDLGAGTQAEVTEAMAAWTQVACTGLTVTFGGLTDRSPNQTDDNNVVGFIESGWTQGSGVLGVTTSRYDPVRGRMVEGDIAFNGDDWTWVTSANTGRREANAATIIGHEGGHFYGIGHSADRSAIMFASYGGGSTPIGSDDQEAICSLYPGTPGPVTCRTTGCPAGQTCVMDMCVTAPPPPTGGTLCTPCDSSAECGGVDDSCLRYPSGETACGAACGSCPSGFECRSVQTGGVSQCVRVVGAVETCDGFTGTTPPATDAGVPSDAGAGDAGVAPNPDSGTNPGSSSGTGSLGSECVVNEDCQSALCLDVGGTLRCTQSCDGSCPAGFACESFDPFSLCVPTGGVPPSGPAFEEDRTIRGGCRAGDVSPIPWLSLTMLVALMWIGRRRTR